MINCRCPIFLKIIDMFMNADSGSELGRDDVTTKVGNGWTVTAGSPAGSRSDWTMCKYLQMAAVHIKCHLPPDAR